MGKSKPEISIVVPTLNEEAYIEEALNSLKSQFIPRKYEIIVSDGFSKDKTVELAKKYADKIVYENKRTIAAGRQTGAKAAEGKVIVCAGADVFVEPHWLDVLTRPIFNGTHVASIGPVLPRDGNSMENAFSHAILGPLGLALSKINTHFVVADNMALDARAFREIGGFNPSLVTGEDTDLIMRMKKKGKVAYSPNAQAYVSMRRVHEWGYWKYLSFHTSNFLKSHFNGNSHDEYEPIR
jgi:glycosyltransferase involved in cell wall biosynthesis